MAYDVYVHARAFQPPDAEPVQELVGDGHEKVKARCIFNPKTRAGRRRKNARRTGHTNGWFMLICPRSGRVVKALQERDPENNQLVTLALEQTLPSFPRVNCFIYDRNCLYEPGAKLNPNLKQIKYFPIDKWHGKGHVPKCRCHPMYVPRLRRRVRDINTSIAEQTFSWFRSVRVFTT